MHPSKPPTLPFSLARTGWGGSEKFSQEPRAVWLLCPRALAVIVSLPLFVLILQKRKLSLRKGKCHIVHPHGAEMGTSDNEFSALGLLTESWSRVLLTVDSPLLATELFSVL